MFVFNGDFVDRGAHQLEVIGLLFALKCLLPERVWLIRGNHEERQMNKRYGFFDDCCFKLGEDLGCKMFDLIQNTFDMLPVACVVADCVLVVHGGIGDGTFKLEDIGKIKRPLSGDALAEHQWVDNLLWSDPIEDDDKRQQEVFGVHTSPRGGAAVGFGWNVTKTFCARNGLSLIVRSHQSKKGSPGFDVMHENLLMRVFSARDYERHGNDGAILFIQSLNVDGKDI
jgi:diadenosine tetraphosphatase ApaH/serine/threonine PP2A family protein phosphatase